MIGQNSPERQVDVLFCPFVPRRPAGTQGDAVTALLVVRGRSQRPYSYQPIDLIVDRAEPVWRAGANFLIARRVPDDEPLILYVGAAPDMFQFIDNSRCWETARWKFGADAFYAHPNAEDASREAEREDLIAAYAPSMNADNWQSIIARMLEM